MKAQVDRDLCIGCSLCAEICPAVFQMGGDMIAKVIVDEVPREVLAQAEDAASSCPVNAITLTA